MDSHERHDHRIIISKIVQALEHDPSWVHDYAVTGELHIPAIKESDAVMDKVDRVVEVRVTAFATYSMF